MDFKQIPAKVWEGLKNLWNGGFIQRTSRIVYDTAANLLLFFIVIIAMFGFFAGGVGAGYFASLVQDEPIRSYESMRKDIYNYEETSKLYFADDIYIGDIRTDLHREEISLDDISQLSIDAVLSTEDQSFYEHRGVVPKAIVRALFQEVIDTGSKSGGSTLTQQLIKNQILTDQVSFERKAKEMLLAMRLEHFFEKDEILEAYLNIVPYGRDAAGRNIAGIQAAAQGIFGIDAKDLSLPQAAYIAGLPQNPYVFTPYLTTGELKNEEGLERGIERMKTVLRRMYQNEVISEREYNQVKNYDIVADFRERMETPLQRYPNIVFELEDQAKEIIKEMLAEEDGYTLEYLEENETLDQEYKALAEQALTRNGYHIYSTIDKEIYDTMQKTAQKFEHYGPDKAIIVTNEEGEEVQVMQPVEVGSVLMENETGRVLGFIPGREDSLDNQYNHATKAERSPGSTIKPLAVYGPGFELGKIQPGTVVADVPLDIIEGEEWPTNVNNLYNGLVSAREALIHSHNVATVSLYSDFVSDNPVRNFLMKMGYDEENLTIESRETNLSTALGSTEVKVIGNVSSFATFANNGKYIKPYWIEKITTADGTVIYEHETKEEDVFSPETSYLVIDILRDVISSGTGTYLNSYLHNNNVDWAGKTGTGQDFEDLWFVGMNPNVTLGTWMGYDDPSSVECKGCSLPYYQRSQLLWANIINDLAEIDPDLITPSERFKQPGGVVSRSYCAVSGLQPTELCKKAGLVRSDLYNINFLPEGGDDSLIGGDMPLVEVDGEQVVAGPDTPEEFTLKATGGIAFNPAYLKRKGYNKPDILKHLLPRRPLESGWSNLSLDGLAFGDEDNEGIDTPPTPKSLKQKDDHIVWKHVKGQFIVGYRIYYAEDEDSSFTLFDHTVKPKMTIPDEPGIYHIKAVNYFGLESEPSSNIIIGGHTDDTKPDDDEDDSKDEDENVDEDTNDNEENIDDIDDEDGNDTEQDKRFRY